MPVANWRNLVLVIAYNDMNKLITILALLILTSCNKDSTWEDINAPDKQVEVMLDVPPFKKIRINSGFTLEIVQDTLQEVSILSRENLIPNIAWYLEDGTLFFEDNNKLKWLRSHYSTTIKVRTDVLERIDNYGSGSLIISPDTLRFPQLVVNSKSHSSIFDLKVNNIIFNVVCNDITTFKVSGKANSMDIYFAASDGRFEGNQFMVNDITVKHNGTNDMIFYPLHSLIGELQNTGDILFQHVPDSLAVSILGRGQLINRSN